MYLGIDPGQSGGMCLMDNNGTILDIVSFKNMTDHDKAQILSEWIFYDKTQDADPLSTLSELRERFKAYIEEVHSFPKQGVTSSFNFGRSYGFLIGLLTGLKIPFETVSPQRWQRALNSLKKKGMSKTEHKNQLKSLAQRTWPDKKITHAIADAMLIAEYGRIKSSGQ